MPAGRIAGLLFFALLAGCAADKTAPPPSRVVEEESSQSSTTQAETVATEQAVRPAAPAVTPAPASPVDRDAAKTEAPIAAAPPKTAAAPTPAKPPRKAEPAVPAAVKPPPKTAAAPTPAEPPRKAELAVPAAAKPAVPPPLDLTALEQRLRDTKAIGVLTKLTLKNQVDDLLEQVRAMHQGKAKASVAQIRQSYDLLLMKVLSLLQDADPPLAGDIVASREPLWGILVDPVKFATIN